MEKSDNLIVESDKVNTVIISKENSRYIKNGSNSITKEKTEHDALVEEEYHVSEEDIDTILGPVSYTRSFVKCLQPLANPITYLVVMSSIALATGLFFYYSTSTITTLERRFGLPSKITGLISTGNDIVSILLSVPLGYIAGRGHRPRWIGSGILLGIVACFLAALPHFIFGAGRYGDAAFISSTISSSNDSSTNPILCNNFVEDSSNSCDEGNLDTSVEQKSVVALQFISQMMLGYCNIQLYVAGYSYLDDAVKKEKSPLYLATAGMLRVFGPVASSLMSMWCLNQWIEPSLTPNITPKHPQWVGAWWLGYLIIAGTMFVTFLPIIILPRMLPGTRKRLAKSLKEAGLKGRHHFEELKKSLRPANKKGFSGIFGALKRISKNRIFVIMCLNQVVFWMGVVVFYMFSNKYMEHQFQLSASEASKYAGIVGMVSTFAGWLLGGSLMTLIQPRPRNVVIITVVISAILISLYSILMGMTCKNVEIIGLDLQIEKQNQQDYISQRDDDVYNCINGCECSDSFLPVCATIGVETQQQQQEASSLTRDVTFFNPCIAGCAKETYMDNSNIQRFENCSCVEAILKENEHILSVVSGECPKDCPVFFSFLMLKSTIGIFISINRVIANAILFRCMDQRDKDLGLGVMNVSVCIGLIIGPILSGQGIDWSCKLWEMKCGKRQSCKLYFIDSFRYILHLSPVVSLGIGLILECCLFLHIDKISLYDGKKTPLLDALVTLKNKIMSYKRKGDVSKVSS